MDYEYSFYTNMGGRADNEDALYACETDGDYLFIVADGLGGHECGELASNLAVSVIKRKFNEAHRDGQIFDAVNAIEEANREILLVQDKIDKTMKTTVTLVAIIGDEVILAHVGDSRIYAFDENGIIYQSLDHSASQMAVLAGEITPAQIRHHADRNVLMRALGAENRIKVDLTVKKVAEIDGFLLCSDGFWEYITEDEMCRERKAHASSGAQVWLEHMRDIVRENAPKNQDNNTAIAVVKIK